MKKKTACFVGNPNVGKSSLFNILTGEYQHTGNWTGKTVENEMSEFVYKDTLWTLVDLPGTYSLIGESAEEKIASEFILKKDYDLTVVVLDTTNLERSMRILLEVMDVTDHVIACFNLSDEACKRGIKIDFDLLQKRLNIPFVITNAKDCLGLEELCETMNSFESQESYEIKHSSKVNHYLEYMHSHFDLKSGDALHLLLNDPFYENFVMNEEELKVLKFYQKYITRIEIIESYNHVSNELLENVLDRTHEQEKKEDRLLNKIFMNKFLCFPFMLILLFFILWLTIYFSNLPSNLLFSFFSSIEPFLFKIFSFLPVNIVEPLIYGGYRTLYWVVAVMLPPMVIFFPLFALLEDYGVLPRIAFQLDKPFACCGSCGKQSLTMCMGLGCNAVGVTGARIMENKKMRFLSILTNVFMPCNGRFPAMICMIGMFFVDGSTIGGSILSALILTLIIVGGILLTFGVTAFLNKFILKKEKTIFLLEMPSFRKPKIWRCIKASWHEKAFHVLKRAMIVSFPAGLFIFFLANIFIGDISIFTWLQNILQPFGSWIGLDGVILLAFLLGMPANEIVIPIMLLGYSGGNMLVEYQSLESLKSILVMNHWTIMTAICFIVFCLCHFPCATTLLTIKKETGSIGYTILAFLLPTILGILLCFSIYGLGTLLF